MLHDHSFDEPAAIRTQFGAIFVSLELSRSTWLITSLSPGKGEKMSKHTVTAGNMAGLLARFSELKRKAMVRTGKSYPIIVIQEAGLDGFWIHRALQGQGIVSHVRIKGLLFSQGVSDHAPLRRDRRTRLEALRTGDGRALPAHLKAQISRELDRLELLLEQIRAVEAERDALLATADKAACEEAAAPQPVAMLLGLKGDRRGFCRRSLVGRAWSALRQSSAGRRLCRLGSDALAERSDCA